MDNLDLDIQNYNLDDILNLFKVSHNFDEVELKKAYKMYLMTHPDKSNLDPKFFYFFGKAFDILNKIYNFRNRKKTDTENYEDIKINEEHAILLNKLNGKSVKDFNNWFNKMFEKAGINENENGYGDWFKNYEDKEVNRVSMGQFQSEFDKKKSSMDLIVRNEIKDITHNAGSSLDNTAPESYTSGIFSKLNYEDLKKAHTETVVPVSKEEFDKREKFNNIEQYKNYRNSQNTKALSLEQSKEYLHKKKERNNEEDTGRVFNILKQDEEYEKKTKKWWGYLKQLEQ